MADATQGRLHKWTDEQRHAFNRMRAKNYTIKEAVAFLKENDEDLHEYAYTTLASYIGCIQGKEEYKLALEEVREEAKVMSFTHRGSRLDTLIEVANKLLHAFRTVTAVGDMTKLAGELRDTMKEIRQEVDPLGLESGAVASHFDKILTGFNTLDQTQRSMILGEPSEWNSTQQTRSN
jgi:hypothetical protein